MKKLLLLTVLSVSLAATASAQAPIILNTTLSAFVPMSGSPWIADIWGYVDGAGNEYALVCRGNSGFSIYNVTNGAAPFHVKTISATGSDLKDVKVWQNYAYLTQQSGNVLIVNLTNPATAYVAGQISVPGGHNIFIADGYLYTCRSGVSPNGTGIYSLANPTNPTLLAMFDPAGFNCHDAYVEGNTAYLFDISSGITRIVDVTNKSNPVQIGQAPTGNHSGWVYTPPGSSAKILFACDERSGGHCNTYDVTNPAAPVHLGSYNPYPAGSVHNPVIRGRYCYIAYYLEGLRIVDLANPKSLQEVGIYDTHPNNGGGLYDGAWGVYPLTENKVILTEMFGNQGFYVINFTPPTRISMDVSTTGTGDISLTVSDLSPLTAVYTAASVNTTNAFSTGPFLGLQSDALFSVQIGAQPFQALSDASGNYQFTASGIPPGLSADFVSLSMKGGSFQLSPIGRIDF